MIVNAEGTLGSCPETRAPGGSAHAAIPFVLRFKSVAMLITAAFAVLAIASGPAEARGAPDSFADLADRLLPSVVNISTTQRLEGQSEVQRPRVPEGSPFEEFFREFFERGEPRQQQQQRRRRATSLGSGFVIDAEGHIVTNNHVIEGADEINVILHDETRLKAEVVGRDKKTDIAVLKVVPEAPLSPVTFGDSDISRVGDWVVAIGNPFGFGSTVTAGIISARGRDIRSGPYDDFFQTDASINRGNSGGPMFNLEGEVIGINTAIYSPSGGNVGIGFAIPSNMAKVVIRQLISDGVVRRGWLGVRIQVVSDEIAESLGLDDARGALVAEVIPGGPAEAAGVRQRDVVLEFNGRPVAEMRRLPKIVAETDVEASVPVVVWRDGKEVTIEVRVGSLEEGEKQMAAAEEPAPTATKSVAEIEALGLTVAEIDDERRAEYGLDADSRGVVVTDVVDTGPAAAKSVEAGDVIVEADQKEVQSPADLAAIVEQTREEGKRSVLLLIKLTDNSSFRFVAVRIEE